MVEIVAGCHTKEAVKMVWKRAYGDDGFAETFPPPATWLWIWGPKFPFVLPGIVKEIESSGIWYGEDGAKIHADLVTHWFDGERDPSGKLVGDRPAPPGAT